MKIQSQSGAVLIISLIILLALTLIGITSSNVTSLQEKMAANNKDINLAFQAAEAALRAAEESLTNKPTFDLAAANTAQGVGGYYTLLNNDEQVSPTGAQTSAPTLRSPLPVYYSSVDWEAKTNPKYITYNNIVSGSKKLLGLSRPPQYIVEQLSCIGAEGNAEGSLEGGTPQAGSSGRIMTLRITARGWGSNASSVAMIQSIVKITYSGLTSCQ